LSGDSYRKKGRRKHNTFQNRHFIQGTVCGDFGGRVPGQQSGAGDHYQYDIQRDDASPGVFMVGDVKQSIYRFRQARPELFLEKYNTYLPDKGSPCRKIILSRNFRSRREVIDAVNFLFKQIMSTGAGELDYTDAEALNFGAVFDETPRKI